MPSRSDARATTCHDVQHIVDVGSICGEPGIGQPNPFYPTPLASATHDPVADLQTQADKFPRRTERRRQTRERILEAAARLFGATGYGGATMNAIAEAADVHVTTLFTHFKTKQELAFSLGDQAVAQLADLIAGARGRTPFFDFYRGLVLETARQLSRREPAVPLWRELGEDPELAFAWVRYERRQIELFADYIAVEYGLDPQTDYRPELVASLMLAASWSAHRRATAESLELEAETASAVATATRMGRAVLEDNSSSLG
jgi:AcrR family transcriptional regulator